VTTSENPPGRGPHRARGSAEVLKWLEPLLPALGITRLGDLTGLDRIGLPVASACRPLSKSLSVSQGKGWTREGAKLAAIFEAAECFHAENIDAALRLGSWNELRGRLDTVDPSRLAAVSVSTYHPDWKMLWIEGRELLSDRVIWLPYELVHLDFTIPLPTGAGAFLTSSNGLGSGGSLDEAVRHAMCEVIERDGVSILGLRDPKQRSRCRVAKSSIDDPDCRALLALLDRAEVDVAIWDATSDIGVPTFHVKLVDRFDDSLSSGGPAVGKGCHPDAALALGSALAEAIQVRLTIISGAREDAVDRVYSFRDAVPEIRLEVKQPAPRRFADIRGNRSASTREDIEWTLARLRGVGLEQVIVVDLTKRELGIPVVRVVIPGCESLDEAPGYVPGPRARKLLVEARP